jgi:quercetin 2,3-dioxygenase
MIKLRRADERGHADHGWLNAYHSFSFSEYYDPRWMGYGALRVINEDRIAPHAGFPAHPHRDMEIITYVMSGALRHRDSTGGAADLHPGELQVMHAGRGIRHSEMNPVGEQTHLLQIWIEPNERDVRPRYEQSALDASALKQGLAKVVAPIGEDAPLQIHADARLYIAWPAPQQTLALALDPRRHYYLHLAQGELQLGEHTLRAGDAAMLEQETRLQAQALGAAQVLLFDLA